MILLLVHTDRQLLGRHEVVGDRGTCGWIGLWGIATTNLLNGVLMLLQQIQLVSIVKLLGLLQVLRPVIWILTPSMTHKRLPRVLKGLLKLLAIEHRLGRLLIIIGWLLLWLAFAAVVLCSLLVVCHQVRILFYRIMTCWRLVHSAVVWAIQIVFESNGLTISTLLIYRMRRRDLLV